MTADHFYTISQPSIGEFKDRGSKFIAYVFSIAGVEEFKKQLAALKKVHPKAAHHCFAYRLGMDGNNFRVSDDGEPSGSAGRPILGQIDSKQLTNVLVVVVRYFGGTLLGVPGLINAYKVVTNLVLEQAGIIQKPVLVNYEIQFDYTQVNEIMRIVKQFELAVIKQDLQIFCSMDIGIPKHRFEEALPRLKELRGIIIKSLDQD